MAYSAVPTVLFGDNYAFTTPDITISVTDNASVSDAEAHASTGNYRNIMYGLLEDMYTRFNALITADRPTKMTFTRATSVNDSTQTGTVAFTVRFTTDDLNGEVSDEPA